MMCPKCGVKGVIVEGLGDGKTRITCQSCGYSNVEDRRGLPLLTEVPQADRKRLLTETR